MIYTSYTPVRCAIVLAAGEGRRLQGFLYRLRGAELPKQFVNIVGTRSMLQHTFDRAEKVIPWNRIFTVVSRRHLNYSEVKRQLCARAPQTVIPQPANRETGPGLLLPLMHIYRRYPQSTVAVFPSDHFVLEEDLFSAHVMLAFRVVERNPDKIVLLGIEPDRAESEYGYIVPGCNSSGFEFPGIHGVRAFVEKPEPTLASELVFLGALWNTMVMVFKTETFLALTRLAAPRLYRSFENIWDAIGTSQEKFVTEEMYREMESLNLSSELLQFLASTQRSNLTVLPVKGVFWSDWGSASRILKTVQHVRESGALHKDFTSLSRELRSFSPQSTP